MFQFDQDYLRVSKPITTDGINLKLDDQGKRMMKIVHLPLSAKPYLIKRNEKLPDNLKLIIEHVEGQKFAQSPAVINTEVLELKKLLEQANAEKELLLQKVKEGDNALNELVEESAKNKKAANAPVQ